MRSHTILVKITEWWYSLFQETWEYFYQSPPDTSTIYIAIAAINMSVTGCFQNYVLVLHSFNIHAINGRSNYLSWSSFVMRQRPLEGDWSLVPLQYTVASGPRGQDHCQLAIDPGSDPHECQLSRFCGFWVARLATPRALFTPCAHPRTTADHRHPRIVAQPLTSRH